MLVFVVSELNGTRERINKEKLETMIEKERMTYKERSVGVTFKPLVYYILMRSKQEEHHKCSQNFYTRSNS